MPPRLIDTSCCRWAQIYTPHSQALRFSTSTPSLAQIPPESPRFIEIPRLIQPKQPFPVRIKGNLPVPRPIISPRRRPQDRDKASPEYLADVTPEPITNKTIPTSDSQTASYVSWKARLSETRRRNLREGLIELSIRKRKTERFLTARGKRNQEERNRLLFQPEREDDRLTNPTVLSTEQPTTHHTLPDPTRSARLALKHQNLAQTSSTHAEDQREKLHTLYVNAGDFIITSKQLDTAIDKAFDDNDQFTSDSRPGLNIWNLGVPETVVQMLQRTNRDLRSQKSTPDSKDPNVLLKKERMRRIGEELTGGKMVEVES